MRKLLLAFLFLVVSLSETYAQATTQYLMGGTTNKSGFYVYTPITVTNGNMTIPGLLTINGGLRVTGGTVDFTGITAFTIPAGLINTNAIGNLAAFIALVAPKQVPSAVISTNTAGMTGNSTSYTFANAFTLTTTATNGTVTVYASAMTPPATGNIYMRIHDASNTVYQAQANPIIGGGSVGSVFVELHDTLTGSAKTYYCDLASSVGSQIWTNYNATGIGGVSSVSNNLGMVIHQTP